MFESRRRMLVSIILMLLWPFVMCNHSLRPKQINSGDSPRTYLQDKALHKFGNSVLGSIYYKFLKFHKQDKTKDKITEPADLCSRDGTKFLEGKCIEVVRETKTWEDAQNDCLAKGGTLFEPNFDNPFLMEYFLKFCPEILNGVDGRVWIGVQFTNDVPFTVSSNTDLSTNPYFATETDTVGCANLDLDFNSVDIDGFPCDRLLSYVCEFPANPTTFVQTLL